MRSRIVIIIFLVLIAAVAASCKKNHYRINTSSIDVRIEIKRLEKDLFSLSPDDITESVPVLKSKYQDFLRLFSYVINTGDIR